MFRPLDGVAALQRIYGSGHRPPMQKALTYVLEGAGYRQAARHAGLKEMRARDVQRAARKLGIDQLHLIRKQEQDSLRYSKRDQAAIEAVMCRPKKASMSQLIRAQKAAWKRIDMLEGS